MTAAELLLLAAALTSLSGLPGLFMDRKVNVGQRLANALFCLGALTGLASAGLALALPAATLDLGGTGAGLHLLLKLDALSGFFLLPIFLIPMLCSIYGLGYWPQDHHSGNGARLRFFFGIMPAAMALTVVAGNSILFLTAWEVMTLAGFFLISTEEEDPKVARAAWHYLVATHVGILCLIALFAYLARLMGGFDFVPVDLAGLPKTQIAALFLLLLIGFGLKAGVIPLHVWLPGAHASAPSHISAILSGVVLKIGVFGVVKVTGLLSSVPEWWGETLIVVGVVSAVLGILYALGQQDIKRLFAYSSIENIGLIFIGLGLGLIGRATGRAEWVVLGFGGALLHVLGHALFKCLLFLSAGSVVHATGTREIDRLGGLAKAMPRTGAAFFLGAVAICGLPPLNGFVGELLIYLGLFSAAVEPGAGQWAGPAFAAPAMALTGALALACFMKVYGTVFLGEPRNAEYAAAQEAPASMTLPMAVLGLACLAIGLMPNLVAPVVDRAVAAWVPTMKTPPIQALAPLGYVGGAGAALLILGAGLWWLTLKTLKGRTIGHTVTWDCGYALPTARMQYTASSFGRIIMDQFAWLLAPRSRGQRIEGIFPKQIRVETTLPDLVLDRIILPSWRVVERAAGRLRVVQQGLMQVYMLYILAATLIMLFWR